MAKQITDETLKFNIIINGDQGRKEYNALNRATDKLINTNKDLEKELKKLNRSKKKNAEAIADVTAKLAANNSIIDANRAKMDGMRKQVGLNNLSTKQLSQETRRLNLEMKDLDPNTKEFKQLANELQAVTNRQKQLRGQMRGVTNAMGKQETMVAKLKTSFKNLIFPITSALAFFELLKSGIGFLKNFAAESIQLATEAKGVEFAFQRLGATGETAFNRIKTATRGLLSDLDIKRSLVEFDNFNISLEETDTLMEFLAVRSTQTGQSIDKLKDSLVEGLSKESKLRIDNLGISASELNDELSKTPDFVQAVANIAKREIAEAGTILDEASNSSDRWNATLENTKLRLGNIIQNSGFISFFRDLGSAILETVFPMERASEATEKQQIELNILAQRVTDVNATESQRAKAIDALNSKFPNFLKNLDSEKASNEDIRDRLKEVNKGYVAKIALQQLSEEVQAEAQESSKLLTKSYKLEITAREALNKLLGVEEANRILETKSIKEAVSAQVELIEAKRKGQAIKITDEEAAMYNIRNLLRSSTYFEEKSNEHRTKANKLQEQQNEFAERYADILKTVNDFTGGQNNDGKEDDELTDEEKEKQLKALEDFERRKLALQNEIALKAEDDEYKRKKLKIEQDTAQELKEIEALEISAAKKTELKKLLAQKEAEELKAIEDLESKKRALKNEIALKNAQTDKEAEILKAEQDAEKKQLEIEKLQIDEAEKAQLLIDLKTALKQQLHEIDLKYAAKEEAERQKELKRIEAANKEKIKQQKALQAAKQAAINAGLDALTNAFSQETAIGKALFLFQKGKAIQEIIVQTSKSIAAAKASLAIANAGAIAALPLTAGQPWVSINTAQFAKQALITKLTAGAQIAAIGATAIKGFEEGLYPITRQQDRKVFNSRISGNPSTQIVSSPTAFLAGERPELIVDPDTFKKMDPRVTDYILALARKPTAANNTTSVSVPSENASATQTDATNVLLAQTLDRMTELLDRGIIAKTYYTAEDELERRKVGKELDDIINEAKN